MEKIADKAPIKKAMLHYYFASNQTLFEAVFMNAFAYLAPQINSIFNSNVTVFEKIIQFTNSYISIVIINLFLLPFVI
jgi:TetR/AcrR family transcriptional regulator